MAKKKKIEEDAWLWLSRPVVPGMVLNNFQSLLAKYGYIEGAPRRTSGGEWTVTSYRGDFTKDEMPIEGFTRAMFEYAYLAALDPTNIPEAAVWASTFGVSYRLGMLFTLAKGIMIGAPILAAVDPQHRWEGGLDETRAYKAAVGGIGGAHPNLNKSIVMGHGSWGTVV